MLKISAETEITKMFNKEPIRILQVVGAMDRGGTETWLVNVLRRIDRKRFHVDFLVNTKDPCPYDNEIRALGSKITPCLNHQNPFLYTINFGRMIKENSPYDIIHSHVHHYSGFVLKLAKGAGIPARIAHSHNDNRYIQRKSTLLRKAYYTLMKSWIRRYATKGLAASEDAAFALFGLDWKGDKRWQVLYCGIDLTPFRMNVDSFVIRNALGIPQDAFVIGHVGRFIEQKNHTFLIDVFNEVTKLRPKTYLLLVGDGPFFTKIKTRTSVLGLSDRVIFAGIRSDVASLMKGAMDVFVFPSLYEGLGLAYLEAQAAGLPCIISDDVPIEGDVVKTLIRRLSLAKPATVWAKSILGSSIKEARICQAELLNQVEDSVFNIDYSVKELEKVYVHADEH